MNGPLAIMVRPLQELLMMVKAEQTKETATLLQAWIQKMFLFLTLWTEMANFSNIFGLYGLSKQYLSQISHFGSVLKENVGVISELLRKANFKSKSMRFF